MLSPRLVSHTLFCSLAAAVVLAPAVLVMQPGLAVAAPVPHYQVGTRLRAKQDCTVKGYAIKKGVVLSVAAVHKGDQGQVAAVDLAFSGMIIGGVDVETVSRYFKRA
jgi:hypothetical protein